MAASTARPATHTLGAHQRVQTRALFTRAPAVAVVKRLVTAKAVDDAAPSDDYHLTADTILWNARHSAMLKKRIAQVRAAEVVADSTSSRPELPPVSEITVNDVDRDHSRLCQWHEDQWQRLRSSQHNLWDDELGHFGAPS